MIIRNKLSNSTIFFCSIDIIITYHISKCFIRPVSNKKRHTTLRRHRVLRSLDICHSSTEGIISSATKWGSSLGNREPLCNRFGIRICLLNITSLTLDIHINSSLSIDTYIGRETSRQSKLTNHRFIIGTLIKRVRSISIQTRQALKGSRIIGLLFKQRRHRRQIRCDRVSKDSIDNCTSLYRERNRLTISLSLCSVFDILISKYLIEMACYNLASTITIARQIGVLDILIIC